MGHGGSWYSNPQPQPQPWQSPEAKFWFGFLTQARLDARGPPDDHRTLTARRYLAQTELSPLDLAELVRLGRTRGRAAVLNFLAMTRPLPWILGLVEIDVETWRDVTVPELRRQWAAMDAARQVQATPERRPPGRPPGARLPPPQQGREAR